MSWLTDLVSKVGDIGNVLSGKPTNASLQASLEQQKALLASYQNTLEEVKSAYSNSVATTEKYKRYLLLGGLGFVLIFGLRFIPKGRAF